MQENNHFTPSLVWLEEQPDFPRVDLTDANTEALKLLLSNEPGIEAQGRWLEKYQRPIHMLADKALNLFAVDERTTRYNEVEYRAFTHGFASMEAITTTVRPPTAYDITTGAKRVAELLIDDTSSEEREFRTLLQPDIPESDAKILIHSHDRLDSDVRFADIKSAWEQSHFNTTSVVLELGLKKHESNAQLQSRLAGACLAHFLQTPN